MGTKVFYAIAISTISCLCGAFSMWIGEKYYKKRFGKSLDKTVSLYIKSILCMATAAALFVSYGYSLSDIAVLVIYIAGMNVISVIDKEEQVIPNLILLIMLGIRFILYIGQIIFEPEYGLYSLKKGMAGMFLWVIIIGCFKIVCRDKLGMGDVKAFSVTGFYMGIYRCSLVLLVTLVIAVTDIIRRTIFKRMQLRDYVSFGPYMAIGSYVALILGI